MTQSQPIDTEAWKELLLKRELEAIGQMSTIRTLMARIQELESAEKERNDLQNLVNELQGK